MISSQWKNLLHRNVDPHHFALHRIGRIRSFLDKQTAERLVHAFVMCHIPRVQTEVPFAGDSLERYLSFTTDRPHDHRIPPPAGDNHGWSGFCCAHRLCVRSPCQHISRMRTFDENSCAISITSPKVDFRPRNPTCLVGTRGQVPASVHTMWLPGKVPLGGLSPLSGTVWTGW